MTAGDLLTAEQVVFLRTALPSPPARILDVGCGRGRLAGALAELGFDVTAIDPDPDAVRAARDAGVDAACAGLLDYPPGQPFDAVVFSRSLHHIPDLPAAVERSRSLLSGEGVLIADEFALEAPDAATVAWNYGTWDLLVAAGLAERADERDHTAHGHDGPSREAELDPMERWRRDHDHDPPLHTGADMLTALRAGFDLQCCERGPYLWVYLCEGLVAHGPVEQVARSLQVLERRLIDAGGLVAIGLRIVGYPLPAGRS